MDNQDWGLSGKGFRRPGYTELLNAVEYKARELFGDGVNLTVRSPLGILLRIQAWVWSILFSVLEDVYNSRYADTAIGNSLYNLGRNIGMRVLAANKATGYLTITGDPGTLVPAGFLVGSAAGLQYVVRDPVTIGVNGSVLAMIQAAEIGPDYNADPGTVRIIVNPFAVAGVKTITNESSITGGRWLETEDEYRARYYKSTDHAGGSNVDAIRAALLNDVDGVRSAEVYENDTDEHDSYYDLPPHSLGAVVYGGLDEEIAKVIYNKKSGGIQTIGSQEVGVLSASGQTVPIRFSRPELKTIWVKVSKLITDTGFTSNDSIVDALVNYIGNAQYSGLGVGSNVIYMQIPGVISQVPGVVDFALEIGMDEEHLGTANIEIGYREKPAVEEGTVIVE